MSRETNEKPLRTASAPIPLGDDELSAVSGAKGQGNAYGHDKSHGGPPWLSSLVQQTNVTNIYQIATDNSGDVTMVAGVQQANGATTTL
ncbi:hypothetical protein [Anaeromyxobacter sp. Fw109-5]|uniref:hypothetical protein n=1 Tax=Anaeromyxobacter sp. (strain Fw109-5) TaxID=404589 RepID=UPI0000ED8A6A|nr:hypothetical protein [Anaeromyxobacter sp. Fw109-5]ABS27314.1 hypothetical protein Anae109_3118 [Anaeromyxobacter sp. Fw109-5]